MGYCVLADVQNEFKNSPTAAFALGATVTDTTVNAFIDEASALIDSYVGQKYVTPITGVQSLLLMSLYARTLAADRVRGILANRQQTNTDANAQVKSDGFSVKDVMAGLLNITRDVTTLVDAVELLPNKGFYSNNNANNVQPTFRKQTRQW